MVQLMPHTHPFNGPLSGTTRVSRYQKGKSSLDFTEARDSEWQWHQLGHMHLVHVMPLSPRHLLPYLNPDWFYLSGTGLSRLSWKIVRVAE